MSHRTDSEPTDTYFRRHLLCATRLDNDGSYYWVAELDYAPNIATKGTLEVCGEVRLLLSCGPAKTRGFGGVIASSLAYTLVRHTLSWNCDCKARDVTMSGCQDVEMPGSISSGFEPSCSNDLRDACFLLTTYLVMPSNIPMCFFPPHPQWPPLRLSMAWPVKTINVPLF